MADRRDFLKVMGTALGCALLAGCGGGGGGAVGSGGTTGIGADGASTLPSGYKFTPVLRNGDTLTNGLTVVTNLVKRDGTRAPQDHPFAWYFNNQNRPVKPIGSRAPRSGLGNSVSVLGAFPGQSWVTDNGQLGFLALDSQGGRGFYMADLDTTRGTLSAVNIRKIVRIADVLPDAPSAVNFTPGDVGGTGTAAVRIQTGDNNRVSIYVYKDGRLTPLLSSYQRLPSLFPHGETTDSLYGALSVHDDDSILMAPTLASAWEHATIGQGLLYLPKAQVSAAKLVLHRGNLLPDTSSTIQTVSAFQLHDEGRYIVSGTANPPAALRSTVQRTGEGMPRTTYLLTGNVNEASSTARLLSADQALGVSRFRSADRTFAPGTVQFNPRIGSDGSSAYILHAGEGINSLYINGSHIATAKADATGTDLSPSGATITQLSAPVVGGDGQVFCVLGTPKGQELCLFSGGRAATLLRTGDVVGGRTVVTIVLGLAARQVNRSGRIGFRVDYTDMSSSLVIGEPV